MFKQNPKITTYSGQKPPYGYIDWWPFSLYVNNELKPFDDKDFRWAISYYIDRQQIIEVGFSGAETVSALADAAVPAAGAVFRRGEGPAREVQHPGIQPQEGRGAAGAKGCKKDGGFWEDAEGKRSSSTSSALAPPARRWARSCRRC